jgi:hypothetical protein
MVSGSKVIGNRTKQLSQAICFSIQEYYNLYPKSTSSLCTFWLIQLSNVVEWKTDNRVWYIMNEISKVCIKLNILNKTIKFIQNNDEFQYF